EINTIIRLKCGTCETGGQFQLKKAFISIGGHKILLKNPVYGRSAAGHRSVNSPKFVHLILEVTRHPNARKYRLFEVIDQRISPFIDRFLSKRLSEIKIRFGIGPAVPVGFSRRAGFIRKTGHDPVVGLNIERGNFMSDATGNAGLALNKERYVGAQVTTQINKLIITQTQFLNLVEHAERQRSVAASAAKTRAGRDALIHADVIVML